MSLSVVIQAGGESLRMGANKALIPFLGRPLIERVIERVRPVADELLVTTNRPDQFSFLNLPLFSDRIPGQGALMGLQTALAAPRLPFVAVVACDMPFVNPGLIQFQLQTLIDLDCDLVVPLTDQGYEPFHAVYRRENCLLAVTAALNAGKKRMISWFDQVNVRELSAADIQPYDPGKRAFININTPEELAAIEQLAQTSEF